VLELGEGEVVVVVRVVVDVAALVVTITAAVVVLRGGNALGVAVENGVVAVVVDVVVVSVHPSEIAGAAASVEEGMSGAGVAIEIVGTVGGVSVHKSEYAAGVVAACVHPRVDTRTTMNSILIVAVCRFISINCCFYNEIR
jgi:hypothetical protein